MDAIVFICCLMMAVNISAEETSEEYIDPIIDLLLNGNSIDGDNITEDPGNFTTGIWKCGNCTDIDDSKIIYSEANYDETIDDKNGDVDTKIELVLDGMRCVTVSADKPGVVKRLTGACDGAVTLHMTPLNGSLCMFTFKQDMVSWATW